MSQCPHYSKFYGVRCDLQEGHVEPCDHEAVTAKGLDKYVMCRNCLEARRNHTFDGHCLFAPTVFEKYIANPADPFTVLA
jgi:hypothetical protein